MSTRTAHTLQPTAVYEDDRFGSQPQLEIKDIGPRAVGEDSEFALTMSWDGPAAWDPEDLQHIMFVNREELVEFVRNCNSVLEASGR